MLMAVRTMVALVLTVLVLPDFGPIRMWHTGAGLDPSWGAATTFGLHQGLAIGTDIVFTVGPLGGIYTRLYQEGWAFHSLAIILICAATAWPLARLLVAGGIWAAAFAVALLFFVPIRRDVLLFAPAFMLVLVVVLDRARHSSGLIMCTMLAGAAAALAKFSSFPLLVIAAVLVDGVRLVDRRLPVATPLLVTFLLGLFTVSGQNPLELGAFIRSSYEVSAAYSAAMSYSGPLAELLVWLVLATGLGLAILAGLWTAWRGKSVTILEAAITALTGALFLFLLFKAGFVRHDLHSLTAWGGLAIAAMASFAILRWKAPNSRLAAVPILVGLATMVPPNALLQRTYVPDLRIQPRHVVQNLHAQGEEFLALLRDPGGWTAAREAREQQARAAIRATAPYPVIEGSVDIIPSRQSELIAHGFDYRPRPTIQEYTTYSPALIARNRAFFEGPRAPRHLFMRPGSIDGRHPALAEGALWPLFLASYEPVAVLRDLVQLSRRAKPLAELLGAETQLSGRLRSRINLPAGTAPMFMQVNIRPTLPGRLLDIAFRPPFLMLTVTYSNGSDVAYRVIPGMLSEGFVISPLVQEARDYLILAGGRSEASYLPRAVAVSFSAGFFEALAYERELVLTLRPINSDLLREASAGNSFAADALRQIDEIAPLLRSNPQRPPELTLVPEGLQAHAPMSLTMPVQPDRPVRLAYGIRDGAWQNGGATDGVCFAAKAGPPDVAAVPLFERCLDPVANAADRGVQEVELDIPTSAKHLILETSCKGNCNWDWSYWSRARQ